MPTDATIPHFLAIEGVIGVGKSTLSRRIAERLRARLVLEEVEENPFLEGFYKDRRRYAFPCQIFFLLSRYRQQRALARSTCSRAGSSATTSSARTGSSRR